MSLSASWRKAWDTGPSLRGLSSGTEGVEVGAGFRRVAEPVMRHREEGELCRGWPAAFRGGPAERIHGLLVATDAVQGDAQCRQVGTILGSQRTAASARGSTRR